MNPDRRAAARLSRVRKLLSGGDRRSLGRSSQAMALVEADHSLMPLVLSLLTDEDLLVRMRAADIAEKLSRSRPELLKGRERYLLERVGITDQQEVRWHMAQILPRLSLSPRDRQRAVDLLKSYLKDKSRIVQACALQGLADFAARDPGLAADVARRIGAAMHSGSPAVRARARHLLERLSKQGRHRAAAGR